MTDLPEHTGHPIQSALSYAARVGIWVAAFSLGGVLLESALGAKHPAFWAAYGAIMGCCFYPSPNRNSK